MSGCFGGGRIRKSLHCPFAPLSDVFAHRFNCRIRQFERLYFFPNKIGHARDPQADEALREAGLSDIRSKFLGRILSAAYSPPIFIAMASLKSE
jgi:hypothetical protein